MVPRWTHPEASAEAVNSHEHAAEHDLERHTLRNDGNHCAVDTPQQLHALLRGTPSLPALLCHFCITVRGLAQGQTRSPRSKLGASWVHRPARATLEGVTNGSSLTCQSAHRCERNAAREEVRSRRKCKCKLLFRRGAPHLEAVLVCVEEADILVRRAIDDASDDVDIARLDALQHIGGVR